jgi:hypothetical protein
LHSAPANTISVGGGSGGSGDPPLRHAGIVPDPPRVVFIKRPET